MTLATLIGSSFMLYQLKDFANSLIAANPDYKFPQLSDFLQTLKICPIIIVNLKIKFFFIYLFR